MNEKFTTVIETLEAAENEMSELHNVMEGLEQRMEARWHEVQTIADYRKRLSSMGQVVRSMLAKRETALLEKVRAEHKMHLTPESLASSQAVVNASALEPSDGDTRPAQAQVI